MEDLINTDCSVIAEGRMIMRLYATRQYLVLHQLVQSICKYIETCTDYCL